MWISEERAFQPGNSEYGHLKHKHAWHVQGRTKRPVWLEGSEQEVETRRTAETCWKGYIGARSCRALYAIVMVFM